MVFPPHTLSWPPALRPGDTPLAFPPVFSLGNVEGTTIGALEKEVPVGDTCLGVCMLVTVVIFHGQSSVRRREQSSTAKPRRLIRGPRENFEERNGKEKEEE